MNSDHPFATIHWTAKCIFLVFQISEIGLIGHLLNQNHSELFEYKRETRCYCSQATKVEEVFNRSIESSVRHVYHR